MSFECEECEKDAVGLIKVNTKTLHLCRLHYRKGIEEYAEWMDEKRLLPA